MAYPAEMSIVSPAKLTLARLYEQQNQPQQALSYYAELARMLKQNPYDPWAAEASERAQLLVSKHPELLKAMSNPAPSGSAPSFSIPETAKPTGVQPPTAPVTPKPSPSTATPSNGGMKLLSIPAGSSNSTSKP
jgi:hypothetical protein